MSVPTLYSVGRLPYLAEFAARLESNLGWKPAYWITQPDLRGAVAALFPDTILHDFTDANRGLNDPVDRTRLAPSDPDLMTRDGLLVRQGLEIVARHVLGNAMTASQQACFFFDRLDYALGVTQALDLQVFVLNSTPHSVMEFCFYAAFRLLGRKVRMLSLTGFQGRQVILSAPDDAPLGLDRLAGLTSEDLSDTGRAELQRLLDRNQDHTPWYIQRKRERERVHANLNDVADALIDEGRYPPGMVDFDRPASIAIGIAGKPPTRWIDRLKFGQRGEKQEQFVDAFDRKHPSKHDQPLTRAFAYRSTGHAAPPITWKQYYTYRDWVLLTKRRWRRHYEQLASGFDLRDSTASPYVYFALHYQPERSTCPDGGAYTDQILALRTIVQALPQGWRLLVKEHPSQFLWQTEGELGRWDGYYEQILALGPVELVPLAASSEQLIRTAKVVVTITGTVGWEACLGGTPAITLARPWYAAPGLVLFARNSRQLRDAFAQVQAGWRPDPDAIAAHLARIERLGRACYLNPSQASHYEGLSDEDNLARLVDLFVSSERLAEGST